MDVTSIHSINVSIDIYMDDDENVIHKYYAPFLSSKNCKDLSSDHNTIEQNEEFVEIKTLFLIYY